jgi:hypothetical protein
MTVFAGFIRSVLAGPLWVESGPSKLNRESLNLTAPRAAIGASS